MSKKELVKGITSCNRTACQVKLDKDNTWWNEVMQANYCEKCAELINYDPNNILCVKKESK